MANQTTKTKSKTKAKTKSTKNRTGIIIGICSAIVVAIVVIVAVVLATSGTKLNDSYFVSDDTKYVLTIDSDSMYNEEDEVVPIKAHLVYTYSGDDITGLKAYYEFANESDAKKAYDQYQSDTIESEAYKEVVQDGKYVILTANESEYEGLTASDIKQRIEFMEMLKDMDLNGDSDDTDDADDSDDNIDIDADVDTDTENTND